MPRARAKAGEKQGQQGQKRNPSGKPRKIKDAEHMAQIVDAYIEHNTACNLEAVCIPTDYDFCEFAGIGASTLDDYRRETDTYPGYSAALKKLVDYREQFLLDLAVSNPKAASIAIFALKQKKNGGYEDKPSVQVEARELTIKTDGDGMNAESFK